MGVGSSLFGLAQVPAPARPTPSGRATPTCARAVAEAISGRYSSRASFTETMAGTVQRFDAAEVLSALQGQTIHTLTGRPNTILRVDRDRVFVATNKSPEGRPVPIIWVQEALDRLADEGEVVINVASVGYRSAR